MNKHRLLLAGLALGAWLASTAPGQTFLRTSAWWLNYDASGYDSVTGIGVEAGRLGAAGKKAAGVMSEGRVAQTNSA